MKFTSDIDIDFGDRSKILQKIKHIPAAIHNSKGIQIHNTGIYVTDISRDPVHNCSSIDYKKAEQRGYIKLDFLNVGLYTKIRNQDHLTDLLNTDPPWHRLYQQSFCEQLTHIGKHYDLLLKMPEAVNSIPRLAMFLALIRPSKRDLIGLPWAEVAKTIWQRPQIDQYYFKKSHSVAYSHLVVVNMNLLDLADQSNTTSF
jgi:hypothetical protein